MGTHLRVLHESYPINTNMTGSDGNRSKNLGRLNVKIHERLIDFERLIIHNQIQFQLLAFLMFPNTRIAQYWC